MVLITELEAEDEQQAPEEQQAHAKQLSCAHCGDGRRIAKRCSLCREVFYCSPGCQRSHWSSEHSRTCRRIYAPPPPPPPKKVENPCVKCGKPGRREALGAWYCSTDCLGESLNSNGLSADDKRLADDKAAEAKEAERLSSWISSKLANQKGLSEARVIDADSRAAEVKETTESSAPSARQAVMEEQQAQEEQQTEEMQHSCAHCGDVRRIAKRCSLCREVFYCSPGCQRTHWSSEHSRTCRRIYAPPPKKVAEVKNPCVKCGKPGRRETSGAWYCSHDCLGEKMGDLTADIKRLANPKSAAAREGERISSFISSTLATQKVAEVKEDSEAADVKEVTDKIQKALGKAEKNKSTEANIKTASARISEMEGLTSKIARAEQAPGTHEQADIGITRANADAIANLIRKAEEATRARNESDKIREAIEATKNSIERC